MVLGACKKKVAPPPPPPPPPPPAPTASLTANPNTVDKGQSTTLTWQTTNATDVSIDGIGAVQANGSQQVTPDRFHNLPPDCERSGRNARGTARVTVSSAGAASSGHQRSPKKSCSPRTSRTFTSTTTLTIFRPDQQSSLQADIAFLKQHSGIKITIEGHCDERGSTEYNLALGDNRANAVTNALVQGGIAADRIQDHQLRQREAVLHRVQRECWQQNRRGHFVYRSRAIVQQATDFTDCCG